MSEEGKRLEQISGSVKIIIDELFKQSSKDRDVILRMVLAFYGLGLEEKDE